jgi:hypothetical protein
MSTGTTTEAEQRQARRSDALILWTVYERPSDFPGMYVARRWLVGAGAANPVATADVIVEEDVEPIRLRLRRAGLSRLPRMHGDDPCILEVWL